MTSVGEVMSIGRSFEEAIQKAIRMSSGGRRDGIEPDPRLLGLWDPNDLTSNKHLDELVSKPSVSRLSYLATAFAVG